MEREKQEQKEVIPERVENLGGAVLEAIRFAQYTDSPEDQMILDFVLSRSPNWVKSADGHWIYNPIDHSAEYRG